MSSMLPPKVRPPALLEDIDWRTYTRLLRAFAAHRGYRLTYDRGTLEIMAPLWQHEEPGGILGHFVVVLADELNLPWRLGGSVTLRRRRLHRGLEPDDCYWIASAPRLQGKTKLDLRVDPPPDLAIEMDVTRSSLDRMDIYASLKVPEVWRADSGGLAFHALRGTAYQVQSRSLSFPQLAAVDLIPFLAKIGQSDDGALLREFRHWVRRELLTRPTPQA